MYLTTAPRAGNFCKSLDITEHAVILISLRALAYFTSFITQRGYFLHRLKILLGLRQLRVSMDESSLYKAHVSF